MKQIKESKHVKNFKKLHLNPDEKVMAFDDGYIGEMMGAGDNKQHNGSLIITDFRVVFYRKGFFGEVIETIPLVNITSIERKSLLGHRTIKIHTSHDMLEFKTMDKSGESRLIDAIEVGRNINFKESDDSNIKELDSPIEQIRKLSELNVAGAITEAEFLTKKEELLKKI